MRYKQIERRFKAKTSKNHHFDTKSNRGDNSCLDTKFSRFNNVHITIKLIGFICLNMIYSLCLVDIHDCESTCM